jgi:hypothetical protein
MVSPDYYAPSGASLADLARAALAVALAEVPPEIAELVIELIESLGAP